jgi:hypothetical protein
LHDDYNQDLNEEDVMEMEDVREASKDEIQKVFVMDHDFVCL